MNLVVQEFRYNLNNMVDNDIYFRYFNKVPEKIEQEKLKELLVLLSNFMAKVYDKEFDEFIYNYPIKIDKIGYLVNSGYYIVSNNNNERVVYHYGEDINLALVMIINSYIENNLDIFKPNDDEVKNYFNNYGDIYYDEAVYIYENVLKKLNNYYNGSVPKEMVSFYEERLNSIWSNKEDWLQYMNHCIDHKRKVSKIDYDIFCKSDLYDKEDKSIWKYNLDDKKFNNIKKKTLNRRINIKEY